MAAVNRVQAGRDMLYKGRVIQAWHCKPELLGTVDGVELAHFYRDTAAVWKAGTRYVDEQEAAKCQKSA